MKVSDLTPDQRVVLLRMNAWTPEEREQVLTFFCPNCLKSDAERGFPEGTDRACQCENDE